MFSKSGKTFAWSHSQSAFCRISLQEDVTSQARQEHLLFHPVSTSVSRYVGMHSPYHMQPCFSAFELQGACWKSRETFKCPRRSKLQHHGILQDFQDERNGPMAEVPNLYKPDSLYYHPIDDHVTFVSFRAVSSISVPSKLGLRGRRGVEREPLGSVILSILTFKVRCGSGNVWTCQV